MILKHLLYYIIILILGIFLFQYIQSHYSLFSIIEGARTYPMPRRHPLTFTYGTFDNDSTSNVVSMNTIIDETIAQFFDKKGVPYMNTIDRVQDYIVGASPYTNGAVSNDLKSKLTDIGFYFLEVVIPMLPTQENPKPKVEWPPLKWSGLSPFKIEIAKAPKYFIWEGPPEDNFGYIYNGAMTNAGISGTSVSAPVFTTSSSSSISPDICNSSEINNSCGIQCPESCFELALNADTSESPAVAPDTYESESSKSSSTNNKSSYGNGGFRDSNFQSKLKYTSNITTLGSSTYTGYDITQIRLEPGTINNTTLTDKIEAVIYEYFTKSGSHRGEPTQKFFDAFRYYYMQFSAMDAYHQEQLRNLVFYVLQTIIPGIPTASIPHFYVQWRPFGKYNYTL